MRTVFQNCYFRFGWLVSMRSPVKFASLMPFGSLRHSVMWGGLLLVCQGLISCSASKTAQCKHLILITQKMAEESSEYRTATEEADILKVAASFDQTADKVAAFKLADPRLTEFQQQLEGIYRGNSEATRSMLTALANKDILTAKLAQDQVNNIGQQEQQVITDINRYCQAP
ncbi:MAG: hypothetical protein VKJ27_03080 [Synechocystis sp.]|nr:hypothetical protein [Synechocystis sp.]